VRILFVEPFYGGSHRAFADGLERHSRHDITLLTLPEGEWRRRMRRGAEELAAAAGALDGAFDAIVATSLLDVAAFLAFTRRRFAGTPVLVYFHENQMTYPRLRGTTFNSWFGQVNYHAALAADRVAFNSAFHRDDFLAALRTLVRQPNNWLTHEGIEAVERRSTVLPVGVELGWLDAHRPALPDGGPPVVLWNHRWEFDKAPETFCRAIRQLAAEGLPFRLALAGDPGPNPDPGLSALAVALGDQVIQAGRVADPARYAELLWRSDVVVSTTRHEFFGVATVEALYCGCFPVAPNRYNYPALVPATLHDRCLWETEADLVAKLREAIAGASGEDTAALRASAQRFDWPAVIGEWDAALEFVASDTHS
jgi:glycosyltransferase involved in cell wall biosynthesis